VDTDRSWIVTLADADAVDPAFIGNKAANLARLIQAGHHVPDGFCLTTAAYQRFIREQGLGPIIQMELRRKPLATMRWEELWDVALRIRSAFLSAEIDDDLSHAIEVAAGKFPGARSWVVRSSAPGEDSSLRSFAGLHESIVGVCGLEEIRDAVRKVWASLWSDAALLYGQESPLDPLQSAMAVVIQERVEATPSGVAFARDPRDQRSSYAIVEAVPGYCSDLVDGVVDPDRWLIHRESGAIAQWKPGKRGQAEETAPLLSEQALHALQKSLTSIESLFGWAPDIEWTGCANELTILQARPITSGKTDPADPRAWYLSLKLGPNVLRRLATLVTETRIPQLQADGERLMDEVLESLDDQELADTIETRSSILNHWKKIYRDEFIPFADGVRHLGRYYNDTVRPDDPYEFVGLLKGQPMLASQRNHKLRSLADWVKTHPEVETALKRYLAERSADFDWTQAYQSIAQLSAGAEFVEQFKALLAKDMDIVFGEERLGDHPERVLRTLLQLGQPVSRDVGNDYPVQGYTGSVAELEKRLFDAAGSEKLQEAREILHIGRLSWKLRDDDNLLVARLESQLLRALRLGAQRLMASGRLSEKVGERVREKVTSRVVDALRDPNAPCSDWPIEETSEERPPLQSRESARQLIGQPAAPGVASGPVCRVRNALDLGRFRQGSVLVCDAIQPMMTHIVPLATAIIERRGGMLIHGAIIARELRIPCVNGIDRAVEVLSDDEWVTVDGYLGIVTLGHADFDLETGSN